MVKNIILLAALSCCASCAAPAIDESTARDLARREVAGYCEEGSDQSCQELTFTRIRETKQGWFVEFSTTGYLYAALVWPDGRVELSRAAK